jgi:hypothetical protein
LNYACHVRLNIRYNWNTKWFHILTPIILFYFYETYFILCFLKNISVSIIYQITYYIHISTNLNSTGRKVKLLGRMSFHLSSYKKLLYLNNHIKFCNIILSILFYQNIILYYLTYDTPKLKDWFSSIVFVLFSFFLLFFFPHTY